jgi:hypothetical protein
VSRYPVFDRTPLLLACAADRHSDLVVDRVAPLQASAPGSFNLEISTITATISSARQAGRPVVLMIGGHPIKLGLSRFLIDLIEKGFITFLATNGAGLIHDFELALLGETSEDVAKWIRVGQFGLWKETARLNDIVIEAATLGDGFGEAIGRTIHEEQFPHHEISIAAAGWRCGIPVTCHVSIGSDIFHGYPNADGAALGAASYTDFLIFSRVIQDLEGGVFLNIGSAVTGPEVYLKALSMARNVARQNGQTISNFTTAVFDVVQLPENWADGPGSPPQGANTMGATHPLYYFRPWKTILCRTIQDGGRSFYVCGDHRETIPALWAALTQLKPEVGNGPGDVR